MPKEKTNKHNQGEKVQELFAMRVCCVSEIISEKVTERWGRKGDMSIGHKDIQRREGGAR